MTRTLMTRTLMTRNLMTRNCLPLAIVLLVGLMADRALGENWPGWRGPRGDGASRETGIPVRWNGQTGENIVWKTPLPGRGHSSPVIWEDRLFVTACVESDQSRILLCIDRDSGAVRWQKRVLEAPLEKKHSLNSFASGTPATDGRIVVTTFLRPDFSSTQDRTPGDMVVAAYDLEGQELWRAEPGRFASVHGYCSSPVLFENLVIVNGDHDGDGYIAALDRDTGKTVWKANRPNNTRSYVTPIIREMAGKTQMLFSGSKCTVSLNPRDGGTWWEMDGPTEQFVASLVENGELVFLTAGFPDHHILAIRPDGSGHVGESQIVWRTTKGCSYVPSPIIEGPYFLVVADNGIASCFDAATGKRHWMERLGGNHSASLVSAEGLVHFTADTGVTKVIRPGESFELVAENPLGEECYSSAAISQGRIYMRGVEHLFCIGKK